MRNQPMTRSIGWSALGLLLAAGVVHAGAPADQYGFFDPPVPDASAEDNAISDRKTNLVWERLPDQSIKREFQQAEDYCGTLGSLWRLPTVKELLTVVDEKADGVYENGTIVYPAIDENAFPDTKRAAYWTSSRAGTGKVWTVHFATGETNTSFTTVDDTAYVRCVKNGP